MIELITNSARVRDSLFVVTSTQLPAEEAEEVERIAAGKQ